MKSTSPLRAVDYWLIAITTGLMGAFFWAIRGTNGYGGISGGTLAGFGWGCLWLLYSRLSGDAEQRPYGNARMLAAITFGIAFGGFTGYGIYTAWVNGLYQMNREVSRDISPLVGYVWFFLCGIHWGGVTGAFMAWVAPQRPVPWWQWIVRIGCGVFGGWLGSSVVSWFPQFFLPFFSEGYYSNPDYDLSARAMRSAPNVLQHVGIFVGFLLFEFCRKDWRAVKLMLLMAVGFAIPFSAGAWWHTARSIWEVDVDFWKNWEMTIGLFGGLTFGAAFYLFNRPEPDRPPRKTTVLEQIFGTGFTLWFAVGIVILGAWEGYIRMHSLEDSLESTRPPAFYAYLTVASLAWIVWSFLCIRRRSSAGGQTTNAPISVSVLAGLLIVIVLSGYLPSVPGADNARLALMLLLLFYTLYVIGSAICVALFVRRRTRV